MILKEIVNKSYYGTIGYISTLDDLTLLESYIIYNLPILKEYKGVIVATNYLSHYKDTSLSSKNEEIWKKYFPECIIIDLPKNRGHNFGTADLDNTLFNYCKDNDIKWLCKSANDVILTTEMLDIEIGGADFYYLKSVGYGGMAKYNFDYSILLEETFPQTNFFFVDITKVDYLNDKEYLDKTYDYVQNLPNYNGKIWEYVKGWTCERFLLACMERNRLSIHHLMTQEEYIKLLDFIKRNNIHDCSHKNIMINGICHYQFPNNPIIII
jgi:hypothetical protein